MYHTSHSHACMVFKSLPSLIKLGTERRRWLWFAEESCTFPQKQQQQQQSCPLGSSVCNLSQVKWLKKRMKKNICQFATKKASTSFAYEISCCISSISMYVMRLPAIITPLWQSIFFYFWVAFSPSFLYLFCGALLQLLYPSPLCSIPQTSWHDGYWLKGSCRHCFVFSELGFGLRERWRKELRRQWKERGGVFWRKLSVMWESGGSLLEERASWGAAVQGKVLFVQKPVVLLSTWVSIISILFWVFRRF